MKWVIPIILLMVSAANAQPARHGGLLDMPDQRGINRDHDGRYHRKNYNIYTGQHFIEMLEMDQSEVGTPDHNYARVYITDNGGTTALAMVNSIGTETIFGAGGGGATHGDGANCDAGNYPLGVDDSGAVQSCTDATTEIQTEIAAHAGTSDAHHTPTVDTSANTVCAGDTTYLDGDGGCDDISGIYYTTSSSGIGATQIADGTITDTMFQNLIDSDTYPNVDTDTTDDITMTQVKSEITSHSGTPDAHHTPTWTLDHVADYGDTTDQWITVTGLTSNNDIYTSSNLQVDGNCTISGTFNYSSANDLDLNGDILSAVVGDNEISYSTDNSGTTVSITDMIVGTPDSGNIVIWNGNNWAVVEDVSVNNINMTGRLGIGPQAIQEDSSIYCRLTYTGADHYNSFYLYDVFSPSVQKNATGLGGYIVAGNTNVGNVTGMSFSPLLTASGADCNNGIGAVTYGMYNLNFDHTVNNNVTALQVYPAGGFHTAGATLTVNGDATGLMVGDCANDWLTTFSIAGAQYGIRAYKPTKGGTNYQVVLEGTGHGTGVWFGGTSGIRIYGSATQAKIATLGNYATANNDVRYNTTTGEIYYQSSSKRFKKDIKPLNDDWYKVLDLRPKEFVDKKSGERGIGYIAEDLDEMGLNHLVSYGIDGKPESINYKWLTIYLVEIVKNQQEEINQLKFRMSTH